jgi:TATA-binding protein-associated factor Taf7
MGLKKSKQKQMDDASYMTMESNRNASLVRLGDATIGVKRAIEKRTELMDNHFKLTRLDKSFQDDRAFLMEQVKLYQSIGRIAEVTKYMEKIEKLTTDYKEQKQALENELIQPSSITIAEGLSVAEGLSTAHLQAALDKTHNQEEISDLAFMDGEEEEEDEEEEDDVEEEEEDEEEKKKKEAALLNDLMMNELYS